MPIFKGLSTIFPIKVAQVFVTVLDIAMAVYAKTALAALGKK